MRRCTRHGGQCHRAGARPQLATAIQPRRRAAHPEPTGKSTCSITDDRFVSDWMNRAKARCGGARSRHRRRHRGQPGAVLRISYSRTCGSGTQVIEAAWRAGARRLLFLGSSSHLPYPINLQRNLFERSRCSRVHWSPQMPGTPSPRSPESSYCEALRLQHGFDAISLMPTNLYGPRRLHTPSRSHVLPSLIRRFQRSQAKRCRDR